MLEQALNSSQVELLLTDSSRIEIGLNVIELKSLPASDVRDALDRVTWLLQRLGRWGIRSNGILRWASGGEVKIVNGIVATMAY